MVKVGAGGTADTATYAQFFMPDCVLTVAGSHQFSGEHKGPEAVAQVNPQHRAATDGTYRVEPQPQLFADGHGHVIGLRHLTADRNGIHLDALGVTVYTIVGPAGE